MKFLPLALLVFCSLSSAAGCLTYTTEVTLRGKLSRHTFAEQPNYESIANGDHAASYFFVSPSIPFCVAAGTPNNEELAEQGVTQVQLVFNSSGDSYAHLRPYLGKAVECRGILFHAITGHHHSAVLLSEAKCRVA